MQFVRRGLTVTAIAGAGGIGYGYNTNEGIRRSCIFWSAGLPIFLHYRYVQYQTDGLEQAEVDKEFNKLHDRYAPVCEQITLDLKGMYLKQAQLVSTRDEFLPAQYMEFCKRTQDSVPTEFGPTQAREIVASSLPLPFDEVFEWFDDKPLGAASIGEAHRARLVGGDEVVVKVQYPGIEAKFRNDLGNIISFARLAMPQHVKPLEEIEKQFLTEFDYVGEAANMQEVHDRVMPTWSHAVCIPRPYMDLCSRDVLVMEYVPGTRLVDGIREQYRAYAARQGRSLEELEEEQKRKLESGELKRRSLEEEAARGAWLGRMVSATDYARNTPAFLYNLSLGWALGWADYRWSEAPLNLGTILDTLNRVHGYEILQHGVFNGDPHPGNVLLCPDGRLGLIDYGQVKRIDRRTRLDFAKLVLALDADDRGEVVRLYRAAGMKTKRMDPEVHYRLAAFWVDRDTEDVLQGLNIQEFMDDMEARDPAVDLPQEYVMASRVSVLMRGMANAFGLRLRICPSWAPMARKVLAEAGELPTEEEAAAAAKNSADIIPVAPAQA